MESPRKNYRNFDVAVYCRVYDVKKMADSDWLEKSFNEISRYLKMDKVYIETFRDTILADKELVSKIKDFFTSRGVKISGALCTVMNERDRMRTFCYSNPEHLEKLREIVEYTAGLFDEIILDDYFFTNCKCKLCINAKGDESWTAYRLKQLTKAAEIVIKTARQVNPDINLIIKYPNWYEHYQFQGYNLEAEPKLFDMIYTGTETRDPEYTYQHLQPYQSYAIMRYLENVKPGKNGGGWVDPFARRNLDRFGQQLRLTLLAKAREITIFCYDVLVKPVKQPDGSYKPVSTVAHAAGNVFEEVDSSLDNVGQPYGVMSYKPYHSSGEDFLHNYLGMLGVPIEIVPEFPYESNTILLTECAKFDEEIVEKIRGQLLKGKTVVITSGLLKVLQGKGLKDIVDVECTDKKALVNKFSESQFMFGNIYNSDVDILIPQLKYPTNDVWETVTCQSKGNSYPLLIEAKYAEGALCILTIPDNFGDLYHLPNEVLTQIKRTLMRDMKVYVESPSKVCLFMYDNDTFILESFLPHFSRCNVVINKKPAKLHDLTMDREIKGFERIVGGRFAPMVRDETVFPVFVQPHSYNVYRFE
jgi:hypothetical protein